MRPHVRKPPHSRRTALGQIQWHGVYFRRLHLERLEDRRLLDVGLLAADTRPPSAPGTPDMLDASDTAPQGITSGPLKTDNVTRLTSPTFRLAAATDESGIQGYWWAVDNSKPERGGTWIARPASGWSATVDVTPTVTYDGTHVFYARAVDDSPAHNLGFVSGVRFTIDTVAPEVPKLLSPANGAATSDTTPTLNWDASTDATSGTYRYRVQTDNFFLDDAHEWSSPDRAVWVSGPATEWDVGPALADGSWNWRVLAEDCAGNQGTWSSGAAFTIGDVAGPTIGRLHVFQPVVLDVNDLRVEARDVATSTGSIESVTFYREDNNTEGLQTGLGGDLPLETDATPGDGWAVTIPPDKLAYGPNTLYAQATDTSSHTSADGKAAVSATTRKPESVQDIGGDNLAQADNLGDLTLGVHGVGRYDQIGNGNHGRKDVDLYKFHVPWDAAAISIKIDDVDLFWRPTLDSYLRLFDADGNQLAANDNGSPLGEPVTAFSYIEATLGRGIYYVGVSGSPNKYYDPNLAGGGIESHTTDSYHLGITVKGPPPGSWRPLVSVTAQYDDLGPGFGQYLTSTPNDSRLDDLDNIFTISVCEPEGYLTHEVVVDSNFDGQRTSADVRAAKQPDDTWTWTLNVSDLGGDKTFRAWARGSTDPGSNGEWFAAPVETIHTRPVPDWMEGDEKTTITFDKIGQHYAISSLIGERIGRYTPTNWPKWLAYRDGARTWNGVYFGELVKADYSLGGKVTASKVYPVIGLSVLGLGFELPVKVDFFGSGSMTIDLYKLLTAGADLDRLSDDNGHSPKGSKSREFAVNPPTVTLTWSGGPIVLLEDLSVSGQRSFEVSLDAERLLEMTFPGFRGTIVAGLDVVVTPRFTVGFTINVGWTWGDATGFSNTHFGIVNHVSAGATAELEVLYGAFSGGLDVTAGGYFGFNVTRDSNGDWSLKIPAGLHFGIDAVGAAFWGLVEGRFQLVNFSVSTDDLVDVVAGSPAAMNDDRSSALANPSMAVPNLPTGVSASDDTSCHNVRVTWNAVSDAEVYEIWRNTTNDFATASKISPPLEPIVPSYDDTTAEAGTQYWYWVKATNAAGVSDPSAPDSGRRTQPAIISPAVARSAAGAMAIAWSQFDLGGTGQSLVVRQRSASGVWGPEETVASGSRFRSEPAVAYFPDGRIIVLWSESELNAADAKNLDRHKVAAAQEIYWSVRDAGGNWSAPQAIAHNVMLDDQPVIVVRPDGKTAVAVWRHCSAVDSIDDPSTMDLWYATFDAATATWTAPAVMFDDATLNCQPALTALNSGDVVATWLSSTRPAGEDGIDETLVVSSIFHAGSWSSPTTTISDIAGTGRQSPRLVTLPDDRVIAFWTEDSDDGQTMRMRVRDPVAETWGASTEVLAPQQWIGLPVVTSHGARVDVVWHCVDGDYSSLFSVSRDFANDAGWTLARELTGPTGENLWPMAAADPSGNVHLAYVPAGASAANFQTLTVPNLPDLAVTASDISLATAPPVSGQANSVRVTVRNTGLVNSPANDVRLFEGDPSAGGSLIGTQPLPGLAIGAETEMEFPWTPTEGAHDLWVVIDRGQTLEELDETNNAAHDVFACVAAPTLALDPASDTGVLGDGWTTDATPTLTGTTTPGTSVGVYVDSQQSAVAQATATAGGYTVTLPELSIGPHTVWVQAYDTQGNPSPFSQPLTLVVDSISLPAPGTPSLDPAVDTGTPGDGITSTVRPKLMGTARPGATVEVYAGAVLLGTTASDAGGSYSLVPQQDLSGTLEITARELDNSGYRSTASPPFNLTVDTTPPQAVSHEVEQPGLELSIVFTEDVSASLAKEDMVLTKVADGTQVDPAQMAFVYDSATKKATWAFSGLPGGKLADGEYTATLAAADVKDAAGHLFDGDGDGTSGDAHSFGFVVGALPSNPPTAVSASDDAFSDKVQVTWNAVSDATAYEVWRNTSADSATASKISPQQDVTGTSYDDATAVAGTQYWYWVKAKNLAGATDFSAPDEGRALGQGSLSGRVYIDNNNDGICTGHATIPHVTITLQQAVDPNDLSKGYVDVPNSTHQQTDDQGWYAFLHLAAGTYQLVQSHPVQFLDAKDHPGSAGGTAVEPDTITQIVLGANQQGAEYNFSERGLRPECISLRSFLASKPGCTQLLHDMNKSPVVDLNGPSQSGNDAPAKFYPTGGPVHITAADATMSDSDGPTLVSLVVTIANPLDGDKEVLDAVASGSISKSYAGNVLTLSGTDTLAHYQEVLRTVTYDDTAAVPSFPAGGDRKITFVACDGIACNTVATTTVIDPPLLLPRSQPIVAAVVGPESHPASPGGAIPTANPPFPNRFHAKPQQAVPLAVPRTERTTPSTIAPSVVRNGNQVVVTGTLGNDRLEFVAGKFQNLVIVNGERYRFPAAEVASFKFDGGGGRGTVRLTGTRGADSAQLRPGLATLEGAGYRVDVTQARSIQIRGGGGEDVAELFDSPGDDTLVARRSLASLSGADFVERVLGFRRVQASATAGGRDKLFEHATDYVLEKEGIWHGVYSQDR